MSMCPASLWQCGNIYVSSEAKRKDKKIDGE